MPEHPKKEEVVVKLPKSGKFVFANGDIYDGEYETTASGSIERCGFGTLTTHDGIVYDGYWKSDKMNGKGSYIHTSGCKYVGDFLNGKFEGMGKYIWPDGSSYEGEFKASKLEGKGMFKDKNGQIWTGRFNEDNQARLKFKLNM